MYKFFIGRCKLLPLALLVFSCCCQGALAQQIAKFTHITTDDGLSQNTVPAILKDKYGFMWFGTEEGLNRYDGYRYVIYRNNPKNKTSIAGNVINVLYEDKAGNLWIGTRGGLSLYNRANDSFINYYSEPTNPNTLSNNEVIAIQEGEHGNLWIGTFWDLNLFNPKTNKFIRYEADSKKPGSLSNTTVSALILDNQKRLWVGTGNGLDLLNYKTGKFTTWLHNDKDPKSINSNTINVLANDGAGNIWIGTHDKGLDMLDLSTMDFQHHLNIPGNPLSLSKDAVTNIKPAGNRCLWVGTEFGLDFYDGKSKTFTTYINTPNDNTTLAVGSLRAILVDNLGTLWVSNYSGGISKYDKNLPLFNVYRYQNGDTQGLSNKVVTSFAEAANGNIWIGTDGGGLNLLDQYSHFFTHYTTQPGVKNSLSTNSVLVLLKSRKGNRVWIGTYTNGLDLYDADKKTFTNYPKGKAANQLSDERVYALYEDTRNNLWIGTNGGGVNVLNLPTQKITVFKNDAGNQKSLSNDDIRCFYEDKNGDMWVGTYNSGISIYHYATHTFSQLTKFNSSLADNVVYSICGDNQGNIWVGTYGGGLCKYDRRRQKFTTLTTENGLSDNSINSIVKDDKGFLWISTNKDLNRFDPQNNSFKNYSMQNGLQSHEFSRNAGLKTSTGDIYFGGVNGFNILDPDNIPDNRNIPPVVITDFQLFNKSVVPNAPHSPLKRSITETHAIRLNYDQSVFTFEFAALDYTIPGKNKYAYMLEGFEKDWNYVGGQRTATYTNLNPGEYTFRVKASNNNGVWNEKGDSIKITIVPPFWLTWWFESLAVLLAGLTIYGIIHYRLKNVRVQKQALEKEVAERTREVLKQAENLQLLNGELQVQSEELKSLNGELIDQTEELQTLNEELHEQRIHEQRARLDAEEARLEADRANQAKSTFLATMSHEIRTPMNGVIGMASLLGETKLSDEQHEYTENIINSGEALLNIINDILDFSKIESGNMELDPNEFELRLCIEEVFDLFAGSAAEFNLNLIYQVDHRLPDLIITDNMRLRQILVNLIGNAMKFTPKGEIMLNVALASENGDNLVLHFEIIDTGIGIPEERLSHLFKPFTQIDSTTTRRYGGTGLGLAITKRLVELLGGEIKAESREGKGTKFSFNIKCEVQNRERLYPVNLPGIEKKRVLIVDDNDTYLKILKAQLEFWNLNTHAFHSGAEVIRYLQGDEAFDMVITDMLMPGMNGLELAGLVKNQYPRVPVVLLSSIGDNSLKIHPELLAAMLTKPVKQRQLSMVIQTELKHQLQPRTQEHKTTPALSPDFADNYPLNILIAEDNQMNQKLIVRILSKLGYAPDLATNGIEVLKLLADKTYDVILMDIQMPEMDGLETTRSIREDSSVNQPYIIAMTANAMQEDRENCANAGMNHYVSKPIKLDLLFTALKEGHKANAVLANN